MKIYDCTMFFDEKMMLELRFNILDKYVDKFVVAESLFTHSGKKKKKNFNINDYKKFKDKIIYILIDKEPKDLKEISEKNTDEVNTGLKRVNSLKRIGLQYNTLSKGLEEASPNDLILLSDCDEIPDLKFIHKNNISNKIVLFKQKIFYYKFNLLHSKMEWFGTKACKKKHLKNFEWLRYIKNTKYPIWRLDTFFSKNKFIDTLIIHDGGWHFTNVKNSKEIYYKLSNYGEHNEFEKSNLTEEKIQSLIDNHELYFNHVVDKTDIDKYSAKIKLDVMDRSYLPEYLKENSEKYRDWIV